MPDSIHPIVGPVPPDDLKLKLIDERFIAIEKLFMQQHIAFKELFMEKLGGRDKALELQAGEYNRRLSALNHEADQLKAMQEKYIPREVYDREVQALRDEIKINNDWRIKQEGEGQGKESYTGLVKWLLPVIITVVFFLIMYYTRK